MTKEVRMLCIQLGIVPTDKIAAGLIQLAQASQMTGFRQGLGAAFEAVEVALKIYPHDRISVKELLKQIETIKGLLMNKAIVPTATAPAPLVGDKPFGSGRSD
jgi:hypothetical protein